MAGFPRTEVGGISLPRLVCGSNWILGYSHWTEAKDRFIKELFDTPTKIADLVEESVLREVSLPLDRSERYVSEGVPS